MGGCGKLCPTVPRSTESVPRAGACKVNGKGCPRGTADQGGIKALGGEATATGVERPSHAVCCTQGCLGGTTVWGETVGCTPVRR